MICCSCFCSIPAACLPNAKLPSPPPGQSCVLAFLEPAARSVPVPQPPRVVLGHLTNARLSSLACLRCPVFPMLGRRMSRCYHEGRGRQCGVIWVCHLHQELKLVVHVLSGIGMTSSGIGLVRLHLRNHLPNQKKQNSKISFYIQMETLNDPHRNQARCMTRN